MNCTDALQLAPMYLSGELEPAQSQQLEAHLRACSSCAHELEQQQAFDALLRASVLTENADSARIESQVRQAIAGRSRHWMYAAAGIAAILLLGLFGIRTLLTPRTRPFYAAAVHDHRVEIVEGQPRRWLTDRIGIGELAKGQGIAPYALDNLVPAGYRLERGRLCRLNGQIFLHLVYVNASGSFSVFIRHAEGRQPIDLRTQGEEYVAGFEEHQLIAVIVSEQSAAAVERFARSAEAIL